LFVNENGPKKLLLPHRANFLFYHQNNHVVKNVKVVAFNGSARKDGNTAILIRHALRVLEQKGLRQNWFNLQANPFTDARLAEPAMKQRTSDV
jgi:hypothetical protein